MNASHAKQIVAGIRAATQKNMKQRGQPIVAERANTASGSAVRSIYESSPHILWMCDQVDKFIEEGRNDKLNRWIGFMQGVMWMTGLATIDEMRTMNTIEAES